MSQGLRLSLLIIAALAAEILSDSFALELRTETDHPSDRAPAKCNPPAFKVAIDVGHTIEAPGAMSSRGVTEYAFNLRLAKQFWDTLVEAGFSQTNLLITRGVGRSQLMERALQANALAVDLFVSIHHDDVQKVYYEKWRLGGKTRSYSDKFSGYSIFVSYKNKQIRESLSFATVLGDELIKRGMHFTSHHAEDIPGERRQLLDSTRGVYRYDQLVVLKHTNAPSVLLEAGVIVNRAEELSLASQERQRLTTAALVAAVEKFCSKGQARND
jgi:N-acetylmuramoyl-L-alanine amidase